MNLCHSPDKMWLVVLGDRGARSSGFEFCWKSASGGWRCSSTYSSLQISHHLVLPQEATSCNQVTDCPRGPEGCETLCLCCYFKEQISPLWHLCPDPGQSQEDGCFPDLAYSFACQPTFADLCDVPWGLHLWSWFWTESNEAGACSSFFLAWNGEWFGMSLLAECVPSGFLLVCICIFNVYASSELRWRPFLSQTNKLFTMLHWDSLFIGVAFNFSATVPGGGDFSVYMSRICTVWITAGFCVTHWYLWPVFGSAC